MKASYLISELEQLIEKHGDLNVMYTDYDKGFMKYIREVSVKMDEDNKKYVKLD